MKTADKVSKVATKVIHAAAVADFNVIKSIPKVLHASITEAVKVDGDKNTPSLSATDPDKAKHYIQRGIEEVSKMMDDLNFELNDALGKGKTELSSISLPEDGTAVINLKKSMSIEDEDVLKAIAPASRKMTIRDEFGRFVSFNITPPANLSKDVVLTVRVIVPSNVVDTMVKSRADVGKVGKSIEKYGKSLIKLL